MKTRNELGIPCVGKIDIGSVQKWDVIEVDPKIFINNRFIVDKIDSRWNIFMDNNNVILRPDDYWYAFWVIRGYPSDNDILQMSIEDLSQLELDYPNDEREAHPVFTNDMLDEFAELPTLDFSRVPGYWDTNEIFLENRWFHFNKRWIIWKDRLKFYAFSKGVSYFI